MNKKLIQEILKTVKEKTSKRNFKQSVDMIVVCTGLDLKKPEHNINAFINLHHGTGKKVSVCALVGAELKVSAKETCDQVISDNEFDKFKDKKDAKKLADKYDFFIAQATIMPKIATAFGRVFGPKGKMPNPKAGCVVPPNANLKPLYEKLQKVVKAQIKNQPIIQCKIGVEDQDEAEVVDNIFTFYNNLINVLPNGVHNIKNVQLKLTMGSSYIIQDKKE
ncbi:MAG: 50S ribosomal protein L1 [Nanoarchaeota archaeon]